MWFNIFYLWFLSVTSTQKFIISFERIGFKMRQFLKNRKKQIAFFSQYPSVSLSGIFCSFSGNYNYLPEFNRHFLVGCLSLCFVSSKKLLVSLRMARWWWSGSQCSTCWECPPPAPTLSSTASSTRTFQQKWSNVTNKLRLIKFLASTLHSIFNRGQYLHFIKRIKEITAKSLRQPFNCR